MSFGSRKNLYFWERGRLGGVRPVFVSLFSFARNYLRLAFTVKANFCGKFAANCLLQFSDNRLFSPLFAVKSGYSSVRASILWAFSSDIVSGRAVSAAGGAIEPASDTHPHPRRRPGGEVCNPTPTQPKFSAYRNLDPTLKEYT